MRKVERRATICLLLAAVLFIGIVVFTWRYVVYGREWASFYGNQQIYTDGELNRGTIYDRNGVLLLNCTSDGMEYSDDSEIRRATVHAVGDPAGNIATGAINMWSAELIGYDLLNGTYDTSAEGKEITLTIDSEANRTAYEDLSGSTGTVGVYNYETGEIYCMVSTPAFDPEDEESDEAASDTAETGSIYFNNFLQGAMTPGSTFKLVTSAAAIGTLSDLDSFTFDCDGTNRYGSDDIACTHAHGTVDFEEALAVSCNGAFGALSREIGATALAEYTQKAGLTQSVDVDGIQTQAGSFTFLDDNDVNLSWAGIGQYEDQVNPCAMMVYVGCIANGGEAIQPKLLKSSSFLNTKSEGTSLGEYLDASTANEIRSMMKNNVEVTYGEYNYSGLDIYAKSGTAETSDGEDAWFVGFIDNDDFPLAFVVWVQNGGTGYSTAGPIARDVLNEIIGNNS